MSHLFGRQPTSPFLKLGLPLVYAATLVPLTVTFFTSFSSVEGDGSLFGILPLRVLHLVALPLLVGLAEFVGLQFAAAFWATRALLPLAIFLSFQVFPASAVFFNVRMTEFRDVQAKAEQAFKTETARVQAENGELRADYQVRLDEYQKAEVGLQLRISEARDAFAGINDQRIDALQRVHVPNTVAERNAAEKEVGRLGAQLDEAERNILGFEAQLASMIARPPAAPTLQSLPLPVPLEGNLSFMLRTFRTPNTLVALLLAGIFPLMVFGSGFLLAGGQSSLGDGPGAVGADPIRDLEDALGFARRLPPARQQTFARSVATTLRLQAQLRRDFDRLALQRMQVHVAAEQEVSQIETLAILKRVLVQSDIESTAKQDLIDVVDRMIATPLSTADDFADPAFDRKAS